MTPDSPGTARAWWREPPPAEQDPGPPPDPEPSLFEPASPGRVPAAATTPPPAGRTIELPAVRPGPPDGRPAAPPRALPAGTAPPRELPPGAPPTAPPGGGATEGPRRRQRRETATAPRRRLPILAITGVVLALAGVLLVTVVGVRALSRESVGTTPAPVVAAVAADGIRATASSTQAPEDGITYDAANTLDGNPATAWNSNGKKDGRGPGMTVTYTFSDPVDLRSITVLNGYQKVRTGSSGKKTVDLFQLNARVHRVRVVTDTGKWTWDLADSRDPQTLGREFGRTGTVRLQVVSVYRSDRYLDLALSEVSFTAAV